MAFGFDQQYDLSWEEREKITRRQELKNRLKQEGVRKRFDPFMQMRNEVMTDPAIDRYMDLRKKGRMPYTPMKPSLFFSMLGTIFIPIIITAYAIDWEVKDYMEGCRTGDIPYSERKTRGVG